MFKNRISYGTFTPGPPGEGTLDLSGAPGGFQFGRVEAIWNQTQNVPIFLPFSAANALLDLGNGLVGFAADTRGMQATDDLVVEYADPTALSVGDATLAAQFGTPGTGISQPAGGAGAQGWWSGILAALRSQLSVGLPVGAATAANQASALSLLTAIENLLAGTLAVQGPGATALSTAAKQDVTNGYLNNLYYLIGGAINISGTVWFDPTVTPPKYYVRRETENVGSFAVSWLNPDGTPAVPSPNVDVLQAVSNAENINTTTLSYTATAGGTGYSNGDVLLHTFGVDTAASTPSIVFQIWLNATQSTVMSAGPSTGTYVQAVQQVSDSAVATLLGNLQTLVSSVLAAMATAAKQDTGNTSLASIDGGLGGNNAAVAGDTGASTTNGFLRWLRDWHKARTGRQTAANSLSVVEASDGPFTTNFGAQADAAATSDTGSFSYMALFKRALSTYLNSMAGSLTTLAGAVAGGAVKYSPNFPASGVTNLTNSTTSTGTTATYTPISGRPFSVSLAVTGGSATVQLEAQINGVWQPFYVGADSSLTQYNQWALTTAIPAILQTIADVLPASTAVRLNVTSISSGATLNYTVAQ